MSRASSQSAISASCALRVNVRSGERKLVFASCWVIVLPPSRPRPRAEVAPERPAHPPGVEAAVLIEAPVLDRDEGLADMRRQLG